MKNSDHSEGSENDDVTKNHCKREEPSSEPSDGPTNKTNGKRLSGNEQADDRNPATNCKSSEKVTINDIQSIKNEPSSNEDGDSEIKVLQEEKLKEDEPPLEAGRRSSRLLGKRPKLTQIITSSDEDFCESDDDDYDDFSDASEKSPSKCGRPPKKKSLVQHTSKKEKNNSNQTVLPKELKPKKITEPPVKPSKEFSTGSFVVLKTDFHASTTPPIWRIDGKALLQKYIHIDHDGQSAYKSTSTYSGWTLNNRDQYYPATVEYISQTRKDIIVKFKRELIVDEDSD